MARSASIQNPQLNSLTYDILVNIPLEFARELPKKFLKPAILEKQAKQFSKSASIEQKLELFSYAGLRWFFIVANEQNIRLGDLKKILDTYKDNKPYLALKSLTERSIFVTSDKEFLQLLGMMSHTASTEMYAYDFNLKRSAYNSKRWDSTFANKELEELKEAASDKVQEVRTARNIFVNFKFAEMNLGIKTNDLLVLAEFYQKPGQYVTLQNITISLGGVITPREIVAACKNLVIAKYTQMDASNLGKAYSITGLGIEKVNKFMKRALTS